MKLSKLLYAAISILLFGVLLLVNLVFLNIYQGNVVIPYSLDETSILLRIEGQGTHLEDPDAFFEYLQDMDKVIAYDQGLNDIIYYNEKDMPGGVWARPSSPYALLADGESITLFGETFDIVEPPFPITTDIANLIVPLDLKTSIDGRYYIQSSDSSTMQSVEMLLGKMGYTFSIQPLAKDFVGTIKELLFYKEGYAALLVSVFAAVSNFTYTRLVVERDTDDIYTKRVFGAGRYKLFAARMKGRLLVYLVSIILLVMVWLFGSNISLLRAIGAGSASKCQLIAGVAALVEFIIIDAICIFAAFGRCCKKMEVR